jgi:transposase
LLLKWRRQGGSRKGNPVSEHSPVLLQVALDGFVAPVGQAGTPLGAAAGLINVEIGQSRIRLRGSIDDASLRCQR